MSDFWAMSDTDKILLVLKILLVAFGWASLIIAAIAVMAFCLMYAKDILERRELRCPCGEDAYSPKEDSQVKAFKLRQTRRHIRAEQDEFFRNVQEIQNELR